MNRYKTKHNESIKIEVVYEHIGMALLSTQRVELISKHLLEYLKLCDRELAGISTKEFLLRTPNIDNLEKLTLGKIFKLLKLNPNISLEHEFNKYLILRNTLVHNFTIDYLKNTTERQKKLAIDFCYEFGKQSLELESFFKGLTYLLALTYVKDKVKMDDSLKIWQNDYDYFCQSIKSGTLRKEN